MMIIYSLIKEVVNAKDRGDLRKNWVIFINSFYKIWHKTSLPVTRDYDIRHPLALSHKLQCSATEQSPTHRVIGIAIDIGSLLIVLLIFKKIIYNIALYVVSFYIANQFGRAIFILCGNFQIFLFYYQIMELFI